MRSFACQTLTLGLALIVLGAAGQTQAQGWPSPMFTQTKSETVVEGVLLRKGRPLSNALLTTCGEYNAVPGMEWSKPKCDLPIELKTDAAGRFRFYQMSGKSTFQCSSPCSADPVSQIWFDVWLDGQAYRANEVDNGFSLKHVELMCDVDKTYGRAQMPAWPKGLQEHAPLALKCDVKRWDN